MNTKLISLLLTSLLLSLGGAGAANAVNGYIRSHVEAADLAPLDVTPTVTETPTETPTPTPSVTPTVTITPTPTPSVGEDDELGENEHESQEELHESNTAKLHEQERSETEIEVSGEVDSR